jgi:hypothetical protein
MRAWSLAATVFCATAAQAQLRDSVQIPLPGPRVIHGFVADRVERPLDSVEVVIASLKRSTFTAADGSFRFEDVKPGKYKIAVRRLGYYPQAREVPVGDDGGATAFFLTGKSATLPPIVSSASRGGLSGVVGDTAFNIIEGASIWVLGSDRRADSDSTGAFFLDLKPGRHMVRVERPGYGSKLVSVTIPNDSGRRVMVWMAPAAQGTANREKQAIQDFSMRLMRRTPVWSTIYTRDDILRARHSNATQLATAGAGKRVDENCPAIIDGMVSAPLWALDPADIETMEVYASRPSRRGVTSINARAAARQPLAGPDCTTRVYVWLR